MFLLPLPSVGTLARSLWATLRVKAAFLSSLAYFLWHSLPLLLSGRRSEP
jgi:hypothetical protein